MTLTSDLEGQDCTLFLGRLCRCTGENQLPMTNSMSDACISICTMHYDLGPLN